LLKEHLLFVGNNFVTANLHFNNWHAPRTLVFFVCYAGKVWYGAQRTYVGNNLEASSFSWSLLHNCRSDSDCDVIVTAKRIGSVFLSYFYSMYSIVVNGRGHILRSFYAKSFTAAVRKKAQKNSVRSTVK
jgi:hypothetical protein